MALQRLCAMISLSSFATVGIFRYIIRLFQHEMADEKSLLGEKSLSWAKDRIRPSLPSLVQMERIRVSKHHTRKQHEIIAISDLNS
jgi:hypothetical protein